MNLIRRTDVAHFCEQVRKSGKRIVFTNGCFDLLHVGHVTYLEQARSLGDFLFVGLNSDSSVKKLKGNDRPLQNENDRAQILLALKSVDAVSVFDEDTPLELIKLVKPQVLVKGGDWAPEKIVGKDFVESSGGVVRNLGFVEGRSTSELVKKIKSL
ncbi:MAG: D-glycero-beta-D-manno-heptose 1-phosphate adenylyltransferase [Oligoflexia bacterium]|nr:D-glycero-beta-D-manno-heptose 1-phosphate adenylyltransferase [Oligoflexia bacterium]